MSIKDLFCEGGKNKEKMSLGRVSFWLFFICIFKQAWITGSVDPTMVSTMVALLAYAGYKKLPLINGSKK